MPHPLRLTCDWLVLILSISLIQWHSIQFWISTTGEVGILWSMAIEAAGLWLWWQRHMLLAGVTSFILITGPILGLTLPLQQAITQSQANIQHYNKQVSAVEQTIIQLKSSLNSYQLTSQTRTGWAARIDKTQSNLNVANQRFEQLLQITPTPLDKSKVIMVISIEVAALLVLLMTQILAIGKLRNASKPSQIIETPLETASNHQPAGPVDNDSDISIDPQCLITPNDSIEILAQDLTKRLDQVLRNEKISQAEWARRNNISAKNVSLLRNHVKRKSLRQELIPKKELLRINQLLAKPITTH